ncbi:MAG: glycoside hydrolase family 2 TIM barrel-domain containing protein [Prevotella sp.]|nr:glycoside hydrolase family 2 TIM barrel-domain containing protein [Prevotella sp.]
MRLGILTVALALSLACTAQNRKEMNLKRWDFSRDGKTWQQVNVPHDWAIEGPFDKKWDIQYLAIAQDGQEEAMAHTGRSGGLPWIGEGQYRTSFILPKGTESTEICFDGAMSEPIVYVNGKEAGRWAYGYNAFRLDITPFVKEGKNDIRVHLDNHEESSRWYPGAGLFRPVKLVFAGHCRIDPWATFFRTVNVEGNAARVSIDTQLKGFQGDKNIKTKVVIRDAHNRIVASQSAAPDSKGSHTFALNIVHPQLWSPETPHLYTLSTYIYKGKKLMDETTQKVGIRTLSVTREHGFRLNGVSRKFQGVCLHHDLGPLGTAANKAAIIRQIRLMKDMGADAIRTSHNMPSKMQMEVCDSMGMMVMAESFDAWKEGKVKNGYNRYYEDWWRKDLTNLILNHRNHPSIVMWSIGNEIPEQWKKEGADRAKTMTDFCHSLDPTRPVTCGGDNPKANTECGFYAALDVPGFNYRMHLYDELIGQQPQGFILGSETTSTVSSRGVYKFPAEEKKMATYDDGQCSSYDLECCGWSNLPDDDMLMQDDRSFTIGQFIWTGIDYLGEPTPYYAYWPSRSSYFGAVDLAGLPKDRFYLYRSLWNKHEQTLHLLPHWTWPGREGLTTPVYCYTSYPTAELFVNGKSQGRITKDNNSRLDRYRLRWNNVVYEPGELKVVAYDAEGNKADEQTIRTAGHPARFRFEIDNPQLKADGEDLAYITVTMTDKDGNECPDADDELTFEVSGAATFRAACNGDATSLQMFHLPQMKLFHGKLVLTVQSTTRPGATKVVVKDAQRGIVGEFSF